MQNRNIVLFAPRTRVHVIGKSDFNHLVSGCNSLHFTGLFSEMYWSSSNVDRIYRLSMITTHLIQFRVHLVNFAKSSNKNIFRKHGHLSFWIFCRYSSSYFLFFQHFLHPDAIFYQQTPPSLLLHSVLWLSTWDHRVSPADWWDWCYTI